MRKILKNIIIITLILMILGMITINFNKVYASTYNQVTTEAFAEDNNGINLFPDSYQIMLNKLVQDTGHTNWKFRALYTDIDWNELVENEKDHMHNTIYKAKNYPETWYPETWYCSCNQEGDTNFFCASEAIISYYMDPRNFLTEKTIFQFLDLSNSSTLTVAQIRDTVKGTYLDGSVNGETYAQMIYDAAQASGEGALSIIVRIFQELGLGKELPNMISGNDPTYPGVYNFFNWGATDGAGNTQRGLAAAQQLGWTTPRKALVEGAKKIANNYTNAGQVNKYLYKFDVVGKEKNELYRHQYMTNVQDPNSQASSLYQTYDQNNMLDKELTFIIPVYKNMPAAVKLPTRENANDNLYFVSSSYSEVAWRTSPQLPSNPASNRIGYLRKDTVVTMLQENVNGFGKISYNGKVGYMTMEYLTKVNTKKDNYFVPNQGERYYGTSKDPYALVSYSAQLQNYGWTGWSKDGNTLGTTGQNRRLETIKISLLDALRSEKLQYRVHVEDYGWMDWVNDGEQAGTVGESKRIEAIQIKLRDSGNYNIKYRVCVEGENWTDWVENGETAGTTGLAQKITAIEVKIEEAEPWDNRGSQYKGTQEIDNTALINYDAYLNNAGWTGWRKDGEEAGSAGQRRKLEALKIELNDNIENESIQYRVYLQDYGWTDWAKEGEIAGRIDENKRIEAIQIKLENGKEYELQYRVHVQDIGWMDWKKNGEEAGTTAQLKRIEAIQIKLTKKELFSVSYKTHVQDIGWMEWVKDGARSGTEGESKRLEAIQIKLQGVDKNITNAIQYKVHVQDYGWTNWVHDGQIAGTEGKEKRLEAIQIELNSELGRTIKYKVHVQDYGWTPWVSNGQVAGTVGESKRIEAIEIVVE